MNFIIFICALFGLQLACFIVGNKASKGMETQQDYFLASKGLTFFPLMMTFIATQVGGGLVLGAAEEAYSFGWQVLFYPLGAVLGLLLLAFGVGKKMAQSGVSTVAQLFEAAFGSTALKKIASLLSIISLFMILVAQIIASKKFMTSLGVDNSLIFFAFWGIVIAYTAMGGLKAVVSTDIVQASFFGVAFFGCFFYALLTNAPSAAAEVLASQRGFDLAEHKLAGWLLMPLLFMVIEQDMGQRCFAAQTPRTVSLAAGAAALVTMALCAIPVYFGVLAKSEGIEVVEGGSVLMAAIMSFTNPVVSALVGCAVLVAIISTADSLINAISSNFSQDFELSFLRHGKSIRTAQIMTACISAMAMAVSLWFDNVVDLLIQSYELSVCCLFIPVCFALYKTKGNFLSAALSMAFGALAYLIFKFYLVSFPKELLCVAISLFGYLVGEAYLALNKSGLKQAAG